MGKEMNVYYMHRNNGDGSASTLFFQTERLAELEEDWQEVSFDEGWAEPSVNSFEGYCAKAQTAEQSYMYKVAELEYFKDEPKYAELARILEKIKELI